MKEDDQDPDPQSGNLRLPDPAEVQRDDRELVIEMIRALKSRYLGRPRPTIVKDDDPDLRFPPRGGMSADRINVTQLLELEMERVGDTDDGWLYTVAGRYEPQEDDPIDVIELRKSAAFPDPPAKIRVIIQRMGEAQIQVDSEAELTEPDTVRGDIRADHFSDAADTSSM